MYCKIEETSYSKYRVIMYTKDIVIMVMNNLNYDMAEIVLSNIKQSSKSYDMVNIRDYGIDIN